MDLVKMAVRRRVTVIMGVLVLIILGAVSYGRLPVDLLPNMNFPGAAVITTYSGAGPQEVENLVTRPIEEVLGRVTNVRRISSTSQEETSVVVAEFEWGTNMDFATLDMREKVDLIKRYLPADVTAPMVVKFDPSMMPIMMISLTGSQGQVGLRQMAEETVKPALERVEGVASISVVGGQTQEVLISVDQSKLLASGVSWSQLSGVLRGLNINLPGGRVTDKGFDYLVRSMGTVESLQDLKDLMIGIRMSASAGRLPAGMGRSTAVPQPVRLSDVAEVTLATPDTRALSRLNTTDSVVLAVQKAAMANTVQVAAKVRDRLEAMKPDLPGGVKALATMDQSDFISRAIDTVTGNAWQGALLAVAILFLFLWDLRSVIVIGLAIPISIIGTFVLMYFDHLTLNLMTLGGLALGVGMLVDNAIVVLENIFRRMQEGEAPVEAAINGGRQVAMAITASTLTTVVVFLPVVFVGGMSGMLFRELALTVTFSLLTSLLVALTFVPMAAAILFRRGERFIRKREGWLVIGYRRALAWVLGHKALVFLLGATVFAVSLLGATHIGGEFIPKMDRGEFDISVTMPSGTTIEETDRAVKRIEEVAQALPEKQFITATIGSSGGAMGFRGSSGTPDVASVSVKLVRQNQRTRSTAEIIEAVRKQLSFTSLSGARVGIEQTDPFFGSGGLLQPVEVLVKGKDIGVLRDLSERIAGRLTAIPGLNNIDTSFRQGRPELTIAYDRDKLAQGGQSALLVGSLVKAAVQGDTVATFKLGDQDLDVVLRLRPEDRGSPTAVSELTFMSAAGRPFKLKDVATISQGTGPDTIQREQNQRVATINAGLSGRDLGTAINDVKKAVSEIALPDGYSVEYSGEYSEMQDAFSGLTLAMVLAVILVYMVMASQFESLLHPFVIMFTMPMAIIGVMAALYFGHLPWSIPSIIASIVLAGVVVNNAIVMIDFINQLRADGRDREEAVLVGAAARLRPILMTTLTTILGLIPMALVTGEGTELTKPLSLVLIGGLSTSTLLTLFMIPIIYTFFDLVAGVFRRRPAAQAPLGDGGSRT
ncbi:MAG TPA: efflux RND transporter permease subunit [Bacillota bacterium]